MAKLLSRSKSESRLGRKARDAGKSTESLAPPQKFEDEPLPSPQQVPRQMENLAIEVYTSHKRSVDIPRPKTSNGWSMSPKVVTKVSAFPMVEERPKTSHGPKKGNCLEEPNFSALNRSYTWSREQTAESPKSTPTRQASSPMLHAFPPRSSSRQQQHPTSDSEIGIGIAIGSPTHIPKTLSDARSSRVYVPNALFSRSLPQHYVSLESSKGSVGNGYTYPISSENKEETARGGWKKFFGKGFFQKRTPQKAQQPPQSQSSVTTTISSVSHDTKISLDSLVDEIEAAEALYQSKLNATPLLDVDIPKVEMERYSVMFDSLLNQQQPKPSIYARRKSNLNAASLGQKISENPAATPTLQLPQKKENLPLGLVNKSPLWLFPATPRTPRTPKSPGRPRAMTTPTESVTNLQVSTPDFVVSKKSRPESDIMPSLLMMLEERSERNASRNEKVPPTPFSVISEGSELDSPYSPNGGYGRDDESNAPWVRKFSMLDEPEWEMVTTTPLRPRTPSPTEFQTSNDNETYVAKAATISIARQISISQRQLLLPVISNPERFVQRSKSTKSHVTKIEIPLVIKPSAADFVNPAPTSAVSSNGIALAL